MKEMIYFKRKTGEKVNFHMIKNNTGLRFGHVAIAIPPYTFVVFKNNFKRGFTSTFSSIFIITIKIVLCLSSFSDYKADAKNN